jgi:uridine kinase
VRVVERYADLAGRVLAGAPRAGAIRLVGVDGPSGAGKTWFAERLAAHLPADTQVVHTDDLLDGWDDQLTFWDRLRTWILDPLAAGRPGRYRRYDWHAGRFGEEWLSVSPSPVVLIEGMSAARSAIRPRLTLAVFVTAPVPERLARALHRDGTELLSHMLEWRAGEDRHFAADATREHMDLVVDGAPAIRHDPCAEYVRFDR